MAIPKFTDLEKDILRKWKEEDVFRKTLEKKSPKGNFVFFEGPPTANGLPHIGHVETRAFKDIIPRFKTMQGYRVERKAGWDTQGLPVELEVEKAIGVSGKKDIEKYGIAKFNEECRKSVWKYKELWEQMTERVGFWLDLEHPYITYENSYIETLWWILKQAWDAKLLVQDYKVVPYCPRCGTALSSHEVAQGYERVKDRAVYVKFELVDEPGTFILAWTTTPWTLPGNVALAVDPKIDYVKVHFRDNIANLEYNFIVAERLIRVLFEDMPFEGIDYEKLKRGGTSSIGGTTMDDFEFQIVDRFKGKELSGKQYKPLFDFLDLRSHHPRPRNSVPRDARSGKREATPPQAGGAAYTVVAADFVTTEEGTGVVHTAVMYGEDDFALGTKLGLPKKHTVTEEGKFNELVSPWSGKYVKARETEDAIVKYLKDHGKLYKEETQEHDYPFCWRCKSPLLYYAKTSWFITMSNLRDELIANNERINWVPEHIKEGRFGEWLREVKDWAISRERYWGTPLPIWVCTHDTQHQSCIGNYQELKKKMVRAGKRAPGTKDFDVHRPYIDEVLLRCDVCGHDMKRVPEVADTWFDSGSMPFAQWHYPFENEDRFKTSYPATFISEAIDQTRGWFYTLLAIATFLQHAKAVKKGPPYETCVVLGHIRDKQGRKLSKSLGNYIDPMRLLDKYGADAVRMYLFTVNQPSEPKNFDEDQLGEVIKKNFMILWNVLSFWKLLGKGPATGDRPVVDHVLDRWVVALLDQTTASVTKKLDQYAIVDAGRELLNFVTDLSTWYVRRSRERAKGNGKEAVANTLGYVLREYAKLAAPFTPFLADALWREVGGQQSVHLEQWPESGETHDELLANMVRARKIVEIGHGLRSQAKLKVRQPLGQLVIKENFQETIVEILKDELNVREVVVAKKLPAGKDWVSSEGAALDITVTDELREQGYFREMVRAINALRKELKLKPGEPVTVAYAADAESKKYVEHFKKALMEKGSVSKLEKADSVGEPLVEAKLGEMVVKFGKT